MAACGRRAVGAGGWITHASPDLRAEFGDLDETTIEPALRLDEELRYHAGGRQPRVRGAIARRDAPPGGLLPMAQELERQGYHLRITRDLAEGSEYLAPAVPRRCIGQVRPDRILEGPDVCHGSA